MDRFSKRSAPMTIGGQQASQPDHNLSQSCPPLKPIHSFKMPAKEPPAFALPQSINENEELDFSLCQDGNEDMDGDDEGPGRSFIRNSGFENISAEEFNSNVTERETFLSQSCPTWGSMFLPDFPAREPKPDVAPAEAAAPADVQATEVHFSKLSFDQYSDNMADLGRSPTIFESLKFASVEVKPLKEEEEEATVEPSANAETADPLDDLDMGFEMDDVQE